MRATDFVVSFVCLYFIIISIYEREMSVRSPRIYCLYFLELLVLPGMVRSSLAIAKSSEGVKLRKSALTNLPAVLNVFYSKHAILLYSETNLELVS